MDLMIMYLWTVPISICISLSSSTSLLEALTVSRLDSSRRPSFSTLRMSSWNKKDDEIRKSHKSKANATKGVTQRRVSVYLHLSVAVCVWVQQKFDGIRFIWKLGVRQLRSKALQKLGDFLHCHCKALNGLQTRTFPHIQKQHKRQSWTWRIDVDLSVLLVKPKNKKGWESRMLFSHKTTTVGSAHVVFTQLDAPLQEWHHAYRAEDDPVALAILHFGSEVWR